MGCRPSRRGGDRGAGARYGYEISRRPMIKARADTYGARQGRISVGQDKWVRWQLGGKKVVYV